MPQRHGWGLFSIFVAGACGADVYADNDGQYGVAMRVYAPGLNDTEFGFYYMNYHSRLPVISSKTGTQAGALKAGIATAAATSFATSAAGFVDPLNPTAGELTAALIAADAAADIVVAIDEQLSQSPEVVEAKLTIQRGNKLVKVGKLKEGLQLYEQALDKWPDNPDLAKKIARISLVELGNNQKAVDFAKKALVLNPDDTDAALIMAVGKAKMRSSEAEKYFKLTGQNLPDNKQGILERLAADNLIKKDVGGH